MSPIELKWIEEVDPTNPENWVENTPCGKYTGNPTWYALHPNGTKRRVLDIEKDFREYFKYSLTEPDAHEGRKFYNNGLKDALDWVLYKTAQKLNSDKNPEPDKQQYHEHTGSN